MADVNAIRAALAAQIGARTGLRVMPDARDQISPPVAIVLPGQPLDTFGVTMDGAVDLNLTVLLIISDAQPSEKTQRALDAYLGVGGASTASIANAITFDPTLGGAVHYCVPINVSNYSRIEYAGEGYFGARINLQVGAI